MSTGCRVRYDRAVKRCLGECIISVVVPPVLNDPVRQIQRQARECSPPCPSLLPLLADRPVVALYQLLGLMNHSPEQTYHVIDDLDHQTTARADTDVLPVSKVCKSDLETIATRAGVVIDL